MGGGGAALAWALFELDWGRSSPHAVGCARVAFGLQIPGPGVTSHSPRFGEAWYVFGEALIVFGVFLVGFVAVHVN